MDTKNSELEQLLSDIKDRAKVVAVNKVDEVNVMRGMLNDPNFTVGVYDKNNGYVGQRCPHNEAISFAKNIIAGSTGLDRKTSEVLANKYEFTKRDATFLLTNMRDFINVYTNSGRKINIVQNANTEAYLFTKEAKPTKKKVPDKDHKGESKEITTSSYTKLVSVTKCPRYKTSDY